MEHWILPRWSMLFTSPVVDLISWVMSVFFCFSWNYTISLYNKNPYPVLTSPLVYVCVVLGPGCSPYGTGDMENLSLSGCLYPCQALLFLLRPFPSLTSVGELAMLSCSTVLSPPPLPSSLLPSSHHFLMSHSLVCLSSFFYIFNKERGTINQWWL